VRDSYLLDPKIDISVIYTCTISCTTMAYKYNIVLRGKENPVNIINYSKARKNLRSVLDDVADGKGSTCIVSKNSQVVVISKVVYDGLIDNLLNAPNPRKTDNE